MVFFPPLPIDPATGCVPVVYASQATSPYTYSSGLKFDANGNLVLSG